MKTIPFLVFAMVLMGIGGAEAELTVEEVPYESLQPVDIGQVLSDDIRGIQLKGEEMPLKPIKIKPIKIKILKPPPKTATQKKVEALLLKFFYSGGQKPTKDGAKSTVRRWVSYDDQGRVSEIIDYEAYKHKNGKEGLRTTVTKFIYDENGNVIGYEKTIKSNGWLPDPKTGKLVYHKNEVIRISVRYLTEDPSVTITEARIYDKDGKLIHYQRNEEYKDAGGTTGLRTEAVRFLYDEEGRQIGYEQTIRTIGYIPDPKTGELVYHDETTTVSVRYDNPIPPGTGGEPDRPLMLPVPPELNPVDPISIGEGERKKPLPKADDSAILPEKDEVVHSKRAMLKEKAASDIRMPVVDEAVRFRRIR